MKKVWISDSKGRSLFGWVIKEEIFAVFFILVILSLANDEKIVSKVNENIYIQFFIFLIIIYCIYNHIPWSLCFVLVLLVSALFSGLVQNVKESLQKVKDKGLPKSILKVKFEDNVSECSISDIETDDDTDYSEKLKSMLGS